MVLQPQSNHGLHAALVDADDPLRRLFVGVLHRIALIIVVDNGNRVVAVPWCGRLLPILRPAGRLGVRLIAFRGRGGAVIRGPAASAGGQAQDTNQGQQQGKYFFHVGVLLCLFDVFYITTKRDLFPEENKSQIHMNRAAVNKRGCALNRSLSAEDIYPHRFQQVSWLARQRLPRLLALAMASAADSSLTVTGSLRVCT